MEYSKAVVIAQRCMERRKRELAVDANMHKKMKANYPFAIRAAKEYDEIVEAMKVLKQGKLNL